MLRGGATRARGRRRLARARPRTLARREVDAVGLKQVDRAVEFLEADKGGRARRQRLLDAVDRRPDLESCAAARCGCARADRN
jgi:hypothetical protein